MVMTTKTLFDDMTVVQADQLPVKSVKLFRSGGAEITRTFPVSLLRSDKNDPHVVEIVNLPTALDSANVLAKSTSGEVSILDHYHTCVQKYSHVSSTTLQELEKERAKLGDENRFRTQSMTFLKTYMDSLAQCKMESLTDHTQMMGIFDDFVQQCMMRSAVFAELDCKLAAIGKRREEKERLEKRSKELSAKIVVVLFRTSQVTTEDVELTVTYVVKEVSWKPVYDLHIAMKGDTPSPAVILNFRCSVTQWTGENRENVNLALTTADQVSQLIQVPEPKKIDVRLGSAYVPPAPLKETGLPIGPRMLSQRDQERKIRVPATGIAQFSPNNRTRSKCAVHVFGEPVTPSAETETDPETVKKEAVEKEGASQTVSQLISHDSKDPITHVANQSVFVPSDRVVHNVLIASLYLQAEFMRVAVPSIDPRVYYTCEVKNTSEYVLLPGTVKTYLNDKHVTSTTIISTDIPQILECCLAVDTGVKTIHSRAPEALPSISIGAFTGKTTTTYTSAIVLQNTRDEPIHGVIVRISIPLPADPRITIILKEPIGLADIDQGNVTMKEGCLVRWSTTGGRKGKEAGLFEWVCDVNPGTEVLKAVWEVCAPQDLKLFEQVLDA